MFLLAYSARVRRCDDVAGWLSAASEKPTHMAASLDLLGTAQLLLDAGLAKADEAIVIGRELARLDRVADLNTLKAIARILLTHRPPIWLRTVVIDKRLATEFIPIPDLTALAWLGADLEPIILAVHERLYGAVDDDLLKRLGDAGELMVMAALRSSGRQPRHVALVSDRYGYDIELDEPGKVLGVEVKTVVPATSARVLLSRNEFDVAQRMGERWKVIQVTLSSQVITSGKAAAADVLGIRELSSTTLSLMAPVDSNAFKWVEGAEFKPASDMWRSSRLVVPADITVRLN